MEPEFTMHRCLNKLRLVHHGRELQPIESDAVVRVKRCLRIFFFFMRVWY